MYTYLNNSSIRFFGLSAKRGIEQCKIFIHTSYNPIQAQVNYRSMDALKAIFKRTF
jgi:hypothetical protein